MSGGWSELIELLQTQCNINKQVDEARASQMQGGKVQTLRAQRRAYYENIIAVGITRMSAVDRKNALDIRYALNRVSQTIINVRAKYNKYVDELNEFELKLNDDDDDDTTESKTAHIMAKLAVLKYQRELSGLIDDRRCMRSTCDALDDIAYKNARTSELHVLKRLDQSIANCHTAMDVLDLTRKQRDIANQIRIIELTIELERLT